MAAPEQHDALQWLASQASPPSWPTRPYETPGPDWGGDDDDASVDPFAEPSQARPTPLPPPPLPPLRIRQTQRRVFLTDEDQLVILRLCIHDANAYRAQSKASFWRHITTDL